MLERIREYFVNSSLHGFHFIFEPDRHWTERIFWVCVWCLSGYSAWICLKNELYAFKHNAVSFVVETDYLYWNTSFPAVSICEQESPDKIFEIAQELYGENRDMNVDFYLKDIAFFDGVCYSCSTYCVSGELNCSNDFEFIIDKLREKCQDLLDNCTWNGAEFPCCDNFLPLRTENGLCFTINSVHTKKKENSLPTLMSNRKTGPSTLEVYAFESVKVYVHSSEDVPYANHPPEEQTQLNWGSIYTMKMLITEIYNDRKLPLVDIEQRHCRLLEETDLDVYEYYGYSSCIVHCRARVQMALCNCTSHYIPWRNKKRKRTCGIAGLSCLSSYAEILRALQKEKLMALNISECECLSSCYEPEFHIVFSDTELPKSDDESQYGTKISIGLDRLPTLRYARKVVRTPTDLVVSIGSTVGLFLGASILNLIELLYYVFVRIRSFNADDLRKRKVKDSAKQSTVIEPRTKVINVISSPASNFIRPSLHHHQLLTQRRSSLVSTQWPSKKS